MFRWLFACAFLCAGAFVGVQHGIPWLQDQGIIARSDPVDAGDIDVPIPANTVPDGPAEQNPVTFPTDIGPARQVSKAAQESRFLVTDKQEAPSERDGQLLVIGGETKPGEEVPAGKKMRAKVGFLAIAVQPGEQVPAAQQIVFPSIKRVYRRWKEGDPMKETAHRDGTKSAEENAGPFLIVAEEFREFRRLDVGDEVKAGQMIALVDPTLAIKEMAIKNSQVNAAEADVEATKRTKDESLRRYTNMLAQNRAAPGSVPKDEIQGAELTYQRYVQEQVSKEAASIKAQQELLQAVTILQKHEVRAAIDGIVKIIYKNRGEAIKNLDPILQLQNPGRLRVEALYEIQDTEGFRPGMDAIIEPSLPVQPRQVLRGHLLEVNCVAVSKGPKTTIVSGSEDRTLRGWDPVDGRQLWQLTHKVPVKAVACSPASASQNLLLAGWGDGVGRLLNLDNLKELPRELSERHRGAITCVAFSPDAKVCATGGDDRSIALWETATGQLLHRLNQAHRAGVTSLQFANSGHLLSAGRDNALVLWRLPAGNPPVRVAETDRRSGDVPMLGVSPDGKRVLFDQGKELRLLSLVDRQIEGVLLNPSSNSNFTTMALFSPDGQTIMTNVGAESRVQLWRAPNALQPRAAELRQFIWTTGQATCGAFSPDSTFAVTGTQDNRVLVWPMPSREEIERKLTAKLTLVEGSLEGASRQVRVWAELDNPEVPSQDNPEQKRYMLLPGGTATMVVFPRPSK